jgi:hypothetical protein
VDIAPRSPAGKLKNTGKKQEFRNRSRVQNFRNREEVSASERNKFQEWIQIRIEPVKTNTLRQAMRAKNRGFNNEPGKDREMAVFIANKVKARAEASDSLNILTPHAKGQQKRKGSSPFEGPAEAKRKIRQLVELRKSKALPQNARLTFKITAQR